jgi:hypothetical protein
MQSIIFIFQEEKISICDLFEEFGFKNENSDNQRLLITNKNDFVSILKDNRIINEFDEHELSSIPFEIGSIFIYEYTSFNFGKYILESFLQQYLSQYEKNSLYFDIEDNIYSSEWVYSELLINPNWDWRS